MIGADIVVPKMWNFHGSKTRPAGDLATAGIQVSAQKTVPETKPDVVRFAGQSSALQLPKRASCWTRLK